DLLGGKIKFIPDHRHNRPCRSVPFVYQPVRRICGARLLVATIIFPAEVRRAVEATVAVALAEKICRRARLPIERADETLMIADQKLRRARECLRFVADVVE